MKFRKEYDSIGSIKVPVDKYWGASTERSKKYFDIGDVLVGSELIKSIAIIKKAAAVINYKNKDEKDYRFFLLWPGLFCPGNLPKANRFLKLPLLATLELSPTIFLPSTLGVCPLTLPALVSDP